MSAGEGQELQPGVAALPRTAGVSFLAHIGRQAVGIARPAAGEARVRPRPFCLAGEWSGLTVPSRQAARRLVGAVARARLGESEVVFVLPLRVQPLSAEA